VTLLPGEVLGVYRVTVMPDDNRRQGDSHHDYDSHQEVDADEAFLFFHSKPTLA